MPICVVELTTSANFFVFPVCCHNDLLALGLRAEHQHPNDWRHAHTQSLLGAALQGQQKLQEAEPLLLQGYQRMKQREDSIPASEKRRLAGGLQALVDLYTAWDKPEEAAKWKQKLEEHQAAANAAK